MSARISIAQLRDIAVRARHQLDDGEHFVLHVTEIPALLALLDAVEAAHRYMTAHTGTSLAEAHRLGQAVEMALARFDFQIATPKEAQ